MNFLNPLSFFLAALLPIIILMYLLRLRRPQQVVSSTFLWQRMVRDVEANAPWQKLQRNIIMILQLLFLASLIFALANPFLWREGIGGSSMIIIIDTSASMAATDIEPSRIEAAKQQAQALTEEAPENTRITVISAGERTEILVSASQDRRLTQQAINSIGTPFGNSDFTTALQITSAITSQQPNTDVILLSDGNVILPDRSTIQGNLLYYPIGLKSANIGITNIQLEQNPSGDNNTLFVQVENFGSEETARRLEIYADDTLINAVDLNIAPLSIESYLHQGISIDSKVIEARLSPSDFFQNDDIAWAIGGELEAVEILLVTEGNRFLETALSLLPNISFSKLDPMSFETTNDLDSDLIIFDGYNPPAESIPASNLFFIGPEESNSLFELTGTVENPTPRPANTESPLLKNISLDGVNIRQASRISLPPWANTGISGDVDGSSIPLLFYGSQAGQRIAVLSFKFQDSDLPIQVAFPLLVANIINWLAPNTGLDTPSTSQSYFTTSVSIPLDVDLVTITQPNGTKVQTIIDQAGSLIFNTPNPGIYTIDLGNGNSILAASNFFSTQESNISPRQQLNLVSSEDTVSTAGLQQSRRHIWRPIAFVALAFLISEWLVYHRGTLSKVYSMIFRREKQ